MIHLVILSHFIISTKTALSRNLLESNLVVEIPRLEWFQVMCAGPCSQLHNSGISSRRQQKLPNFVDLVSKSGIIMTILIWRGSRSQPYTIMDRHVWMKKSADSRLVGPFFGGPAGMPRWYMIPFDQHCGSLVNFTRKQSKIDLLTSPRCRQMALVVSHFWQGQSHSKHSHW